MPGSPRQSSPAPSQADRQDQGPAGRRGGKRAQPEGHQGLEPVHAADHAGHHRHHGQRRRYGDAPPHDRQRRLPPRQRRGHAHQEQQGQAEGHGQGVEVRRPYRHLLAVEGLVEEREHRPQQNHESEGHEQHVVAQECPLPAERGVDPSRRSQPVAPPGDQSRRRPPAPGRRSRSAAGRWWNRKRCGQTGSRRSG